MSDQNLPSYSDLHQEHREWLNELNFYHDEIKYFQTRLAEVSSKKDEGDVHQKVVNFKSDFFDMLMRIDQMRYDIFKHEKEVADHYELSRRTRVSINDDHHSQKQRFEEFKEEYEALKKRFNQFLEELT